MLQNRYKKKWGLAWANPHFLVKTDKNNPFKSHFIHGL